jgi:hypothetical protein
MRSSTTRRLAIAVAIAVLTVQAGVALATPGVGISATVLGQGTFSERVKGLYATKRGERLRSLAVR